MCPFLNDCNFAKSILLVALANLAMVLLVRSANKVRFDLALFRLFKKGQIQPIRVCPDRLNLSLFERLQLRQIDPPRRPCQFGNGTPRSEREQSSLRFGFVSSVQKGTNSTDPSITVSLWRKLLMKKSLFCFLLLNLLLCLT